jgi:SAM-dependent methyltransferase
LRWFYYVKIRRRINVYEDQHAVMAQEYSFKRIFINRPSDRILKLIMPMSVIDRLTPDSKILAIGCRFEADLLYLVGHGFHPKNVRGLDMISYSPWIDCGNMHKMSYADNTWDGVLIGWTLAYSDDEPAAAREILRVVRPGGVIALSVSWYPMEMLKDMKERKAMAVEKVEERNQTVESILKLFEPNVDHVYFSHDPSIRTKQGACLVIFSVKK